MRLWLHPLVLLLGVACGGFSPADDKRDPKPTEYPDPPKEVIEAFRKLDATLTYRAPSADPFAPWQPTFRPSTTNTPKSPGLPTFEVGRKWTANTAKGLPNPEQAWGLSLTQVSVTDNDLKEFATRSHLSELRLSGAGKPTSVGVRELAALKHLTAAGH